MARRNTIEILIKAKDDASGVIEGVGSAVVDLGEKNLGVLSGIAKTTAGALAGVTVAAGGIGAAMIALAKDAAPLEQVREAFDGIAASAQTSGKEMLNALKKSSNGMIAQRDLMLSFNKASSLVSRDFAVKLPEAMELLSKVSASTGQDMNFMLDSLVTGVGRVSPMILDNLGIQVSLAEATEEAAKMFGVQADELTKAQQQAGLMNVVLAKLQESTAAVPDAAGSAAVSFGQLGAMLQDTKDAIGLALLPAIAPMMTEFVKLAQFVLPLVVDFVEKRVTPALLGLSDIVGQVANISLRDLGGVLRNVASDVLEFFGVSSEKAWSFALGLQQTFDGIIGVVRDFRSGIVDEDYPWDIVFPPAIAGIIDGIVGAIGFLRDNSESLKGALAGIAFVMTGSTGIAAAIKIIAPLLGGLLNPMNLLVAGAAVLGAAWQGNWFGIRDTVTDVWNNSLRPALDDLRVRIQENLPAAIAALSNVWDTVLRPAFDRFVNFVTTTALPAIGDMAAGFLQNLPGAIDTISGFFQNTLIPAIEKVVGFFGSLRDRLVTDVPAAANTFSGFFQNTIKPALESVWVFITERVIPALSDIAAWLGEKVPLAIDTAKTFWENTLLPAMQLVWSWANEHLFPFFESLGNLLQVTLAKSVEIAAAAWEKFSPHAERALEFLKPVFDILSDLAGLLVGATMDALSDSFNRLTLWLDNASKSFDDLAVAISDIKLPGFLTPGSPTPLEVGIIGITDALGKFAQATGTIENSMASLTGAGGVLFQQPQLTGVGAPVAGDGVASDIGAGGGNGQVVITGPITVVANDPSDFLRQLQALAV